MKKNLRKRVVALAFAFVFAFMSAGSLVLISTMSMGNQIEVADAVSLTTSEIKTIQTKLKRWGYYTGSVDGIYGTLTKQAVIYFQKVNGLQVDGIVGTETATALGMTLSSSSSSSSSSSDDTSVSSNDLYLLAKCVYAEARGEIYTGQVAVAAVVLNRVESADFPNTIAGVIYQPYAFTAVSDGQINLEPDETAYSAARDALNGWDPTYGALYYYNASTATSSWIYSRTTTVVIGNHVFAI